MKDIVPYFQDYLEQLYEEIEAYPSDAALWELVEGIGNSGGTLALHLIGNLNHFIGHGLGDTGYIRNRPEEFNSRNVSRADLVRAIKKTSLMVEAILSKVEDLEAAYPENLFGQKGTNLFFVCKLLTHLSYHVGQINYHRRILSRI